MVDIWNITYRDKVSEDPKVGQHCLMNTNGAAKAQCPRYKLYTSYIMTRIRDVMIMRYTNLLFTYFYLLYTL